MKVVYDNVGCAYLIPIDEEESFRELLMGLEAGDHEQEQMFIETFGSSIYMKENVELDTE